MTHLDTRPTWMEIDLDAVDSNVALIRRLAGPGIKILASVKANAYGHGVVDVSQRLAAAGVEILATGSFADAAALRESGIDRPILMMGGTLPSGIPDLFRLDLMPTVHNRELAEAASAAATGGRRRSVYIKVDCGLGRLGVPLREARPFVLDVARLSGLEVAGLYTHLPFWDADSRAWAIARMALFDRLIDDLARDGLQIPVTQVRASNGILEQLKDRCTAVSPGALLYGMTGEAAGAKPVMRAIRSRLIHITPSSSDRGPAYDTRFAAKATGPTGVVPFGRVDGNRMPVAAAGAHMLIGGRKAPILSVSLEHAVIDLSAVPNAVPGTEVVILGRSGEASISLQDIARWQGWSNNDVVMALNERMPRLPPSS